MRIYNLTDKTPPGKPSRTAKDLPIVPGVYLAAGKAMDAPDGFDLAKIAGWLYAEMIAVDVIPKWYQDAEPTPVRVPNTPPAPEVTGRRRVYKKKDLTEKEPVDD